MSRAPGRFTAAGVAERRALDWGLYATAIGPRLRLLRNMLSTASIEVSQPFGLPTGSLTVMVLVTANPESSQADLARGAGITGPGLVGVIDELEKRGLVSRIRSDEDRRRNRLVLTEAGEVTMQALFAAVESIEAPIRAELGTDEMAQLLDCLDRAIEALSQVRE